MVPPTTTLIPRPEVGEDTRLSPPWKVILHNDNVTTMEFVVWLLQDLFHKPREEAVRLMLEIHHRGVASVARTTRERAELYVEQVQSLARPRGFPLAASIEPD